MKIWGVKVDTKYYMIEFNTFKMNNGEIVIEFINILCKLYYRIPNIVNPSNPGAMVAHVSTFESKFFLQHSYHLDENCDLKVRTLSLKTHILCQKHQNQPLNKKLVLSRSPFFLTLKL